MAARTTALIIAFAAVVSCGGAGGRTAGPATFPPGNGPEIVYVWADVEAGEGDGSRVRPFTSIAAAVAAVRAGGFVIVAAGEYAGDVTIDRALTMTGVDRGSVVVAGIRITGGGPVTISSLTIRGGAPALSVRGGDTTIDNVTIDGAIGFGVWAKDGRLAVLNSSVIGTRAAESDGHGVFCEETQLQVRASIFEDNDGRAIYQRGGKGSVVGNRIDILGSGIAVTSGGEIDVRGNDIRLARPRSLTQTGVFVGDAKGTIVENRILSAATGVLVGTGGEATVARNRIERPDTGVAFVDGFGTIEENEISDSADRAISVQTTPRAIAIRKNKIARATGAGISLYGVSRDVVVEENEIENTRGDSQGMLGHGIYILYAAPRLRGNKVTGCFGGGVAVHRSTVEMDGDTVRANLGPGVALTEMADSLVAARLVGVKMEGNRGVGMLMINARATATELSVSDTVRDDATGFSDGVAMTKSTLTAERMSVGRSVGNGIFTSIDSKLSLVGGAIEANGKFGVMAGCGADVSIVGTTFSGNILGDRNQCP